MNDTGLVVIDNFLDFYQHEAIADLVGSNQFPWYPANMVDHKLSDDLDDSDNFELTHNFYSDYSVQSGWYQTIQPIVERISPSALVRIRAALMPKRDIALENAYHVDVDFDCFTAIYYVNTNNGYTKFKSGEIVESVANRFMYFNSQNLHTGTSATDSAYRCLINFNYFKAGGIDA